MAAHIPRNPRLRRKRVQLIYLGHGLFTTRARLTMRRGQVVHADLTPTPITDSTRGILPLSARLAKRLADPELSVWNS